MTWPTKTDFVDGDVLTAAQVNNIGTNLNLFDPTSAASGYAPIADGAGSVAWGAAGGMTLLSTTSLVGQSSVTISNINQGYQHLYVTLLHAYGTASPAAVQFIPNNQANWRLNGFYSSTSTFTSFADNSSALGILAGANQLRFLSNSSSADQRTNWIFWLYNYSDAYSHKMFYLQKSGYDATNGQNVGVIEGASSSGISTADITSLVVSVSSGTFSAGDVKIWGLR